MTTTKTTAIMCCHKSSCDILVTPSGAKTLKLTVRILGNTVFVEERHNRIIIISESQMLFIMKCHVPDLLSHMSILPANGILRLWCAVRLSRICRLEGGDTSPTSQEQWAVFSWITVASSPLLSHWSAAPYHSPRQETVTNRNHISSQSANPYRGDSFSE